MRRRREGDAVLATVDEQLSRRAQARPEEDRTGRALATDAPRAEDALVREIQHQPGRHPAEGERATQPVRLLLEDEAVPGADTDEAWRHGGRVAPAAEEVRLRHLRLRCRLRRR